MPWQADLAGSERSAWPAVQGDKGDETAMVAIELPTATGYVFLFSSISLQRMCAVTGNRKQHALYEGQPSEILIIAIIAVLIPIISLLLGGRGTV
jgi:hypothetical protein